MAGRFDDAVVNAVAGHHDLGYLILVGGADDEIAGHELVGEFKGLAELYAGLAVKFQVAHHYARPLGQGGGQSNYLYQFVS